MHPPIHAYTFLVAARVRTVTGIQAHNILLTYRYDFMQREREGQTQIQSERHGMEKTDSEEEERGREKERGYRGGIGNEEVSD